MRRQNKNCNGVNDPRNVSWQMDHRRAFQGGAILPMQRSADGYQRRRAIVDLHAEGWSNTAIGAYLQTPRHRVYEVLKRWAEEGHAGLEDRPSSAPQSPARKVTMDATTEVRKLVGESPELGAYRVHAALEQIGIHLSQAMCGRLLALNHKLYGLPAPSGGALCLWRSIGHCQ